MKERNILPEEVVMVGDRSEDILAAKEKGVKAIGVTYGLGRKRNLLRLAAGNWMIVWQRWKFIDKKLGKGKWIGIPHEK